MATSVRYHLLIFILCIGCNAFAQNRSGSFDMDSVSMHCKLHALQLLQLNAQEKELDDSVILLQNALEEKLREPTDRTWTKAEKKAEEKKLNDLQQAIDAFQQRAMTRFTATQLQQSAEFQRQIETVAAGFSRQQQLAFFA